SLDCAVDSWTNCVIESAKQSIGTRIIWKGNKPWWTDSLYRKRKHQLKKKYSKNKTETNYKKYKRAAIEKKIEAGKTIVERRKYNTNQQQEILQRQIKKKLKCNDIHNQMIKNGGQALIDSLVVLFNWSFKSEYCSNSKTIASARITGQFHCYLELESYWKELLQ
ncbi:hypothetical protein RFI_30255, partial [Reticulomyxa filosa]